MNVLKSVNAATYVLQTVVLFGFVAPWWGPFTSYAAIGWWAPIPEFLIVDPSSDVATDPLAEAFGYYVLFFVLWVILVTIQKMTGAICAARTPGHFVHPKYRV